MRVAKTRELSGGQAAVASLQQENVEHVFGLIGSATMELFDALYDAADIRFIGVRDERTGTHMADGYARASGKAGVIIAGQNGPGATRLFRWLLGGPHHRPVGGDEVLTVSGVHRHTADNL